MGGDPDVDLTETAFQRAFIVFEKRGCVFVICVNSNAHQSVTVACTSVLPTSRYANGIHRDTAKLLTEFIGSLVEFFGLDLGPVVIVQR